MGHYNNPRRSVDNFFDDGGVCQLPQFEDVEDCDLLYPGSADNSDAALDKLSAERNAGTALFEDTDLNGQDRNNIVQFLQSLTDPCVLDRDCLAPWIADTDDTGPDGQQLNAQDVQGNLL